MHYDVIVGRDWLTRSAHVATVSGAGERRVILTHDGPGKWLVDDLPRPDLDGCLDVDLESSASPASVARRLRVGCSRSRDGSRPIRSRGCG